MATLDEPGRGGGTDVLDRELEKLLEDRQLDDGDHERFSHYVPKDKILESALTGKPVRAPEKFPICPDCKKIYETLRDK